MARPPQDSAADDPRPSAVPPEVWAWALAEVPDESPDDREASPVAHEPAW